jgi:hypothetical protein
MSKETAQKAALMFATTVSGSVSIGASWSEWLVPRVLVRILLSVVDLFYEGLGFLLIYEGQGSHAVFKLEGVEEDTVLIILESIVDLLIPYYSSICWL